MNSVSSLSRRRFGFQTGAALAAAYLETRPLKLRGAEESGRIRACLSPGAIGVQVASQKELNALAQRHGFDAVEPRTGELAGMELAELAGLLGQMQEQGLEFGSAGLPVDFRKDDARFEKDLRALPGLAAGLQRAGVTRVGTWLMPCHDTLTYLENFRLHARRLKAVAEVLKDHGLRLGLEYVGTQTLRNSRKFPFIHSMRETWELIWEIGTGNVGFVLDSWHWWTAGDSVEELTALQRDQVVSVDLNDAPVGLRREDQLDGERELPMATGVIDLRSFLKALQRIGYAGPARAEPFNAPLRKMENGPACEATIRAMREALALVTGARP